MSASEPNGNGNGSQRKLNRAAARAYWLALPEERRTFVAVARRFGVSDRRISQVAKADRWNEALEEAQRIEEGEMMRVLRREIRSRAERLGRTLRLYDAANDLALELLPLNEDGSIDRTKLEGLDLSDLLAKMPGLFRMAELAAGEATDRVAISDVQPVLVAFARIAVLNAPAERRGDVMELLEAASAGLVQIGAGSEAAA